MLWLLEFLNFATIIGSEASNQILQTPIFFNFNDQISNFITSKDPNDVYSTHNCLIVPCTVVDRQQNCMVITKLMAGGDCYTKQIQSTLNFTSEQDVVTLEFAYLAVHHPQAKKPYTGITVGWTNDHDDFNWIAAEDITLITSGVNQSNSYAQFVTINSLAENTWTKVRTHIHLNQNEPFRIVFESFIESADFAGQFLITNISIFDRGICSTGCSSCLSFYECTSCDEGRLYRGACVSDLCYFDAGDITSDKISVGWILESKGFYGIKLKNIKVQECHTVKFIMNKANSNYTDSSSPDMQQYQYYFPINSNSLSTAGCQYLKVLPQSKQEGYSCYFEFYLLLKDTAVDLVNITWTQEFYYSQDKTQMITGEIVGDNISFQVLTQTTSLGTATTQVEGQVLLCQSSTCRSYYTEPQVLYLNDPFYILVKLDEKYRDFGADFQFELVSAIALGNGTSIPLTAVSSKEKNMTATIYGFKVPLAVGNCTISITAQLVERSVDDQTDASSGRRLLRLLQTTNTTANLNITASSGFSVSGKIKVEGFQILPGWIIYSKQNVPYIIIGVSAGFIVFLIFSYCLILAFCSGNQTASNGHSEFNSEDCKLVKIEEQEELQRIKEKFKRLSQ